MSGLSGATAMPRDCSRSNAHGGGCPPSIAAIIDPRGEVVAGVSTNEEGLLVADADLALARACKVASDPAGHYSRPDLFRLEVDGREIYPGDRG